MADRVARAGEGVIGQLAVGVDDLAVDEGGRAPCIAADLPRAVAHVAVLAGDALLGGGRRPVLLPDGLELDAGMDRDLVAGDAELRLDDHVGLNGLLGDPQPAGVVWILWVPLDRGTPRIADRFEDSRGVEGAEEGHVDVARRDPPRAVVLAVGLPDAVAGDAGDAFLGGAAALPPGDVAPLGEGGADAGVTADAEVLDRSRRQVVDLLLEPVEHRR